jgi:PilZ domain-containing protein
MLDEDRVTSPAGARLGPQYGLKAQLERRGQKRQRALLRVALLHDEGIKDLCVVKNISASGLSARVYRKLTSGTNVRVEFRSGELLSGSVVWERDWEVGIVFPKPIDVESVLASRWITEEGRRRTLPRIALACRGQLTAGPRSLNVMLQDISQGGARVQTEAPETDIRNVLLSLPDLPPIAGVVRWLGGTQAGISFNECIAFEQLARWIQTYRARPLD